MNSDLITYLSGNIPGGIIILPLGLAVFTIIWSGVWLGTRFWEPSRYFAILVLGWVIVSGGYAVVWKRSRPVPIPVRVIVTRNIPDSSASDWKMLGLADRIEKRLSASPKHFVVQRSDFVPVFSMYNLSENRLDSLAVEFKAHWLITVTASDDSENTVLSIIIEKVSNNKIKPVRKLQFMDGSFDRESARLCGEIMRELGDQSPPLGRYGLPMNLPDEAFRSLYQAIELREADHHDSAAAQFTALWEKYPEWARAYQELALTRLEHNTFFYKEIIHNSLLMAIELDSSDPENYILLTRLFLHYREWDEAESAIKLALNLTLDDPRVFFYLSRLKTSRLADLPWIRKKDMKSHALKLAPGYEMARLTLAETYRKEKNRLISIKLLEEGLRYDPDSAPLLLALAAHQVESEKNEEAIKTCERLLELRPAMPEALYNMGLATSQMGKYDEGIAILDSSWRLGGTVDNLYYIGLAYEKKGDWKNAIQYLQERTLRLTASDDPVATTARRKVQQMKRWTEETDSSKSLTDTVAFTE